MLRKHFGALLGGIGDSASELDLTNMLSSTFNDGKNNEDNPFSQETFN
jgi:hypothetical protein